MGDKSPSEVEQRYFREQAQLFAQTHGPDLWKSFCLTHQVSMPVDENVILAFDAGLRTGFAAALQCVHTMGLAEEAEAEEPAMLKQSSIILP